MTQFSPSNLKSYICAHVFDSTRPVLLVVHEDADWSFLCGGTDHSDADYRVVGIGHLIDRDPSLNEVSDLASGFGAERSAIGQPWIRSALDASAC
jgi:hypothetical protein